VIPITPNRFERAVFSSHGNGCNKSEGGGLAALRVVLMAARHDWSAAPTALNGLPGDDLVHGREPDEQIHDSAQFNPPITRRIVAMTSSFFIRFLLKLSPLEFVLLPVRQKHGVDHMNYAVGGGNIGLHDVRIVDHDFATVRHDP
jgi:hypothetical protein